jgi:predicted transcriptional regulator
MSKWPTKKQSGGARPGAGRPKLKTEKRQVLLNIDVEVDGALGRAAEDLNTSKSMYAQEAIQSRLKRDKAILAKIRRQATLAAARIARQLRFSEST